MEGITNVFVTLSKYLHESKLNSEHNNIHYLFFLHFFIQNLFSFFIQFAFRK